MVRKRSPVHGRQSSREAQKSLLTQQADSIFLAGNIGKRLSATPQAGKKFNYLTPRRIPCRRKTDKQARIKFLTRKTETRSVAIHHPDRILFKKKAEKRSSLIHQADRISLTGKTEKRSSLIHQADRIFLRKKTEKRYSLIHQADRISLTGKTKKRSPLTHQADRISLTGKTEKRSS